MKEILLKVVTRQISKEGIEGRKMNNSGFNPSRRKRKPSLSFTKSRPLPDRLLRKFTLEEHSLMGLRSGLNTHANLNFSNPKLWWLAYIIRLHNKYKHYDY